MCTLVSTPWLEVQREGKEREREGLRCRERGKEGEGVIQFTVMEFSFG